MILPIYPSLFRHFAYTSILTLSPTYGELSNGGILLFALLICLEKKLQLSRPPISILSSLILRLRPFQACLIAISNSMLSFRKMAIPRPQLKGLFWRRYKIIWLSAFATGTGVSAAWYAYQTYIRDKFHLHKQHQVAWDGKCTGFLHGSLIAS